MTQSIEEEDTTAPSRSNGVQNVPVPRISPRRHAVGMADAALVWQRHIRGDRFVGERRRGLALGGPSRACGGNGGTRLPERKWDYLDWKGRGGGGGRSEWFGSRSPLARDHFPSGKMLRKMHLDSHIFLKTLPSEIMLHVINQGESNEENSAVHWCPFSTG